MKLLELQDLHWAVRKSQADGYTKNLFADPHYKLIWVDIEKLMQNTDSMQRISLSARTSKDDGNIIGNRVQRAKEHWKEGGYMNPSNIAWNESSKSINFGDGRHRLVAAYQMGETMAPVFVDVESLPMIQKVLGPIL